MNFVTVPPTVPVSYNLQFLCKARLTGFRLDSPYPITSPYQSPHTRKKVNVYLFLKTDTRPTDVILQHFFHVLSCVMCMFANVLLNKLQRFKICVELVLSLTGYNSKFHVNNGSLHSFM